MMEPRPISTTTCASFDVRFCSACALALIALCGLCSIVTMAQTSETTRLVSINHTGTNSGNSLSVNATISANGRFVVFVSHATDLVAGVSDTNNDFDIFVRDLQTNRTMLVTANRSGAAGGGGGGYSGPLISDDGRFVAFSSGMPDYVANDFNIWVDVFVRDLQTGTTQLVSVNREGRASDGNRSAILQGMSANGRFVLFYSSATDLVANRTNDGPGRFGSDLYVRDLQEGKTILVSVTRDGLTTGNSAVSGSISADGRFVLFSSSHNDLVLNDNNDRNDLFLRDLQASTTTLVSVNHAGTNSGNDHSPGAEAFRSRFLDGLATMSADGRYVVFHSLATDLVPNGVRGALYVRDMVAGVTTLIGRGLYPLISANGRIVLFRSRATGLVEDKIDERVEDIFARDLQTGMTTLVSANTVGVDSTRSTNGAPIRSEARGISADGRFVVFESNATDLVANNIRSGATIYGHPYTTNVYVRDLQTNTTTLLSVERAGTSSVNEGASGGSISADGRVAVFQSVSSEIVATDTNNNTDVFVRAVPQLQPQQPAMQPARLQLSGTSYSIQESNFPFVVTKLDVAVVRVGDVSNEASVDYETADTNGSERCEDRTGLASARCDYATSVDTLRFAPGERVKVITVSIINDHYVEGEETFTITLLNPTNATLNDVASAATVTILDDDRYDHPENYNNLVNSPEFFVRQHYLDFLSREPDLEGFQAWVSLLNPCRNDLSDPECDRVKVSQSFFLSDEFQLKGFYVYKFYKATLGRLPRFAEIIPDMRRVAGQTDDEVFRKRDRFAQDWVDRPDFRAKYQGLGSAEFVDALLRTAGVTLANRDQLVADLNAGRSRAEVVRAIVESGEVSRKEFNSAFVLMQYVGYLRRDPDEEGYQAWLRYLNANPQDFRTMVNGFVNSTEYRLRFGHS